MIKIVNEDCYKHLKTLHNNYFDVVITSPPYNFGGRRKINTKAKAKYEHFTDNRSDYADWSIAIIEELLRVTKKHIFWNVQALSKNKQDVFKIMGHFADHIIQNFIWYKPNSSPSSRPYYVSNYVEYVLCISNEKYLKSNLAFNKNFFEITNKPTKYPEHNAVMSQELADELVERYTNENDLILDPFCGVGTTGISAKKFNRHFYGIDIVKRYCEISEQNLLN